MKVKALAAGLLAVLASGADAALLNVGNSQIPPGSNLFISIFNTVTEDTYFRNLGSNFVSISQDGGTLAPVDLAADPLFAPMLASGNPLTYNIAATWQVTGNFDNVNSPDTGVTYVGKSWGLLITGQAASNFDVNQNGNGYNSLTASTTNVTNYANNLNTLLTPSTDSGFAVVGNPQSWNNAAWGTTMGSMPIFVSGGTNYSVGQDAKLFYLTNDFVNGTVTQVGSFNLNAAGTLTYTAGTGVVPVPAAVWLFGSSLAGLLTFARRSRKAA
ncbi:MAG: VPLPA-CTERM sorting domain-containing protein [Candidatus Methylumidiphilus sp.]